ncbi:MAG: S9 family peptidase [Candidatus Glassbacteria bacterium]|nr:S9 family peptidase [Candidatus Glassbacteria bacterium]
MTSASRFSPLFFICVLLSVPSAANSARPLEFSDLLRINRISSPAVSPDGKRVAFVSTTFEPYTYKSKSDIYLVPLTGGEPHALTTNGRGNGRPMFTPDGGALIFASSRSGSRQFYRLPLERAGEAEQITSFGSGAMGGALSPDGEHLLFHSRILVDSSAVVYEQDPDKPRARIIDNLLFRHWDRWRNGGYSHLFVQKIGTGEAPVDLTPGRVDCPPVSLGSRMDYAVGAESKHVYYVANRDPMTAKSTNNDLWRVDIDGGGLAKLTANPADDNMTLISPDGRYLAYRAMARAGFESDRQVLWLRDLQSGRAVNLTGELDRSVGEVIWDPGGRYLYFTATDEGKESIYRVNAGFGDGSRVVEKLTNSRSFSALGITPDGRTLVALRKSFHEPAELVAMNADGTAARNLTSLNDPLLAELDMRVAESFRFPAEDGVPVHGFLIRPPGFDAGKIYPLVYLIHGGPQGAWTEEFHYRWNAQMWASWGYVIVMVNPRGSTGYGQQFTDQISGDWGGKCYRDLMRGLDYVLANYDFIDPERLGAAGASFGGYMINWINGHTERFDVLVNHDGVYNLESEYGSTEELWFPEWEFAGTPWDNPTLYRLWSPHRHAAKFSTPELIIHGEQDFRVPPEQGLMPFTTLKRMGIDTRLLYFPNEGHWVQEAKNSELWHNVIREWLDKYLKP